MKEVEFVHTDKIWIWYGLGQSNEMIPCIIATCG